MRRASGILLHLTSLPSRFGIGDLGPEARRFVDFLHAAKQRYWQVLPLSPTDEAQGSSPYSSQSTYALNPLLVSPEQLIEDGLLSAADIEAQPSFPDDHVDFHTVAEYKRTILDIACRNLAADGLKPDFQSFCEQNSSWLDNYAFFVTLKSHFDGKVWSRWPVEFRERHPGSLHATRNQFEEGIFREKAIQFILARQWSALKRYCEEKEVAIVGDLPIYVNYDSADVWGNPEIFKLNADKKPEFVAGVPPDYFSRTGQLWGNPVYNWDVLRANGFGWWIERLRRTLSRVDVVRIDHFRGLVAYWQVEAGAKNALKGEWIKAPVREFLDTIRSHFSDLPILAEDLGLITDDVREILRDYRLPGMKVLQFAFSGEDARHPYLPHNYECSSVVYTGTHDNNTVRGWYRHDATSVEKERLSNYLGRKVTSRTAPMELIRLGMISVSDLAIFPMQDVLGLGQKARMNKPSTADGNWQWRMLPDQLTEPLSDQLANLTAIYGRA